MSQLKIFVALVTPCPKYFQAYKGATMKACRKTVYDKVFKNVRQKGHVLPKNEGTTKKCYKP